MSYFWRAGSDRYSQGKLTPCQQSMGTLVKFNLKNNNATITFFSPFKIVISEKINFSFLRIKYFSEWSFHKICLYLEAFTFMRMIGIFGEFQKL